MSNPRRDHIRSYLQTLQNVLNEVPIDEIENVLRIFEEVYERDGTVFICGNGGSAATASHWVCDFSKGTNAPHTRRFKMIGLNDNLPMLTAYANDVDYTQVFAEPLRTYAKAGDAVVLITASGNSPNILEAAKAAREMGVVSLAFVGFGGGKLAALVDHKVLVQCHEYGPVEDLHMILDHIVSLHMRAIIAQNRQ